MLRDLGYYWIRIVIYIALSICVGTIFFDIGTSYTSIWARGSCGAFVAGYMTFMSIGGFPSFLEEMKVVNYSHSQTRLWPMLQKCKIVWAMIIHFSSPEIGVLPWKTQSALWHSRLHSSKLPLIITVCCNDVICYRDYYILHGEISVRILPLFVCLPWSFQLHCCRRELHDDYRFTCSQLFDGNHFRSRIYGKDKFLVSLRQILI